MNVVHLFGRLVYKIWIILFNFFVFALVIPLLTLWATLALYFSSVPWHSLRICVALAYVIGTALIFFRSRNRWRAASVFFIVFVVILIWWIHIPATNNRNWDPSVAVLPWVTIGTNTLTIHNIRDFDYSSPTNYTVHYYTRTFDLNKCNGVDFAISYFGKSTAVAHTMLSFRFDGGKYLVLSVEVRRIKDDNKDILLTGIFKQYEIIYILGDERDLYRLRTNYRKEELYLYPTTITPTYARKLLVDIVWRVNKLVEEPEFYNTVTHNCTVTLVKHLNDVLPYRIPVYRMFLLNGYADHVAYEQGGIWSDMPFEEMKKTHLISGIAQQYNTDPDFSVKIRDQLPGYNDMLEKIEDSMSSPPAE